MRWARAVSSYLWVGALTLACAGAVQLASASGGAEPARSSGAEALVHTAPGAVFAPALRSETARRWVPWLEGPATAEAAPLRGAAVLLAFALALALALPLALLEVLLGPAPGGATAALRAALVAIVTGALAAASGAAGPTALAAALAAAVLLAIATELPRSGGRWATALGVGASGALVGLAGLPAIELLPVRPDEVAPRDATVLVENPERPSMQSEGRPAPDTPLAEPRRIIVITVDTLRADHLSLYGYERETSPRLERLVEQGQAVAFERAHAPSSWTKPSTTSLLTSRHPIDHGVGLGQVSRLQSGELTTVAEAFAAQGWSTAAFVTHVFASSKYGLDAGFQHFWELDLRGRSRLGRELRIEAVNFRMLPWLEAHRDERLFVYVHLFDPHWDYDPPAPFDTRFTDASYEGPADGTWAYMAPYRAQRRHLDEADLQRCVASYDGEIAYVDHHLGALFDRLRELDMWDDTAVVLVSDHGEEFQEHDSIGHGWSLYEELLRVPLLLKPAGGLAEGMRSRVAERVSTLDVGPTLLELAGLETPQELRGRTLLPLLERRGEPRDVLARTKRFGLKTSLVHDRFKLIRVESFKEPMYDLQPLYLFDLEADPGEQTSLVDSEPALLEAMSARMDQAVAEAAGEQPRSHASPVELSEQERQALRALGYTGL